ncbi:oxidoreductase [Bowmanella pacifica]|uniref:Oxidoreductase n=1 Tax=Bowmanella pacifica TaxID=502051 RepID=A0A918DMA3_9ALTE|nr:oxidoreductase [Bowmanella pacifica]GGO74717.1 oxidoreductase [Bowmanella pacifica]
MSTPIRTAVIGFGLSAKVFHLPFIQASARFSLTAISSTQSDAVRQAFPHTVCFGDAKQLIDQAECELVIITAPNQAHFELAQYALSQGKHVLVEKPLTVSSQEAQQLIDLATHQGKVLAPFHNRRWDGDFLTVKQLIETEALGEVRLFESHFDRFRPTPQQRWRENSETGSGILYDLGPHLIDQALALFGPPEAITARVLAMRPAARAVDYFHLQLHYPNKEVILHADPYQAGPNPRFKVQGNKGTFIKFGLDPQEARLRAGVLPIEPTWAEETTEQFGTLYLPEEHQVVSTQTGGYQHLFSNLADAIDKKASLLVSAQQALLGIKIIESALQSHLDGRTLAFRP